MKATHDGSASPAERQEIFNRLNSAYLCREDRLKPFWLEAGIRFGMRGLDAACGSGAWMRAISRQFESLEIIGIDLAQDFLTWAKEQSREEGFENLSFHKCDLIEASQYGKLDFVHIGDLLAGLPDPQTIIASLSEAILPGGLFLIEDIDLDLWKVLPEDPRWDQIIRAIQSRGRRHAARELTLMLEELGFIEVTIKVLESRFPMNSPSSFQTLHTFLRSEEDQRWVQEVLEDLRGPEREGIVGRVVISCKRP